MPVADKKGSKKSKKEAPLPPPLDITVRDCMFWPEPKPKGKRNKGSTTNAKPEIYSSTFVRRQKTTYDEPEKKTDEVLVPFPIPHPQIRKSDGTVIEALRGWPGSRDEENDNDVIQYEMMKQKEETNQAQEKLGKDSRKNKKGKKETLKAEEENVYIGDLIQHKYLNEYAEKRRKEMEKEKRRKEIIAAAEASGRRAFLTKNNVKTNRTSQLRSIALADKVETNPLDLWKMPRFTKGIDPHLATTANGNALGRHRGGRRGFIEESLDADGCDGGGCCCDYSYRVTNYVSDDDLQGGEEPNDPCSDDTIAITD